MKHNFRHVDDTTLLTESKEDLEGLTIKVKMEREQSGLILNIR